MYTKAGARVPVFLFIFALVLKRKCFSHCAKKNGLVLCWAVFLLYLLGI